MRTVAVALPVTVAVAVAVTLAGCGGDGDGARRAAARDSAAASATPVSATEPTTAAEPTTEAEPTTAAEPTTPARRAIPAVDGPLTVRRAPAADAAVLTTLPARTRLGSPRVLLVEEGRPGWIRVALPIRPNGSAGWVRASDVRVEPVDGRILVDLAGRRITLDVGGERVTARVAVGAPANPTPTGTFYVTDRVRPPRTDGPYGHFALGLSGHSERLSEFGGGDGQIGIHGTDQPSSLGRAVSHGCVRVPDDIARLLPDVPLGTPVVIT